MGDEQPKLNEKGSRTRKHRLRDRLALFKRPSQPSSLRSVTEHQNENEGSNSSFDGLTESIRTSLKKLNSGKDEGDVDVADYLEDEVVSLDSSSSSMSRASSTTVTVSSDRSSMSRASSTTVTISSDPSSMSRASSTTVTVPSDEKKKPRRVSWKSINGIQQSSGSASEAVGEFNSFQTQDGSLSFVSDSLGSSQNHSKIFDSSITSRDHSGDGSRDPGMYNMGVLMEHDKPPQDIFNKSNTGVSVLSSEPDTGQSMPSLASHTEIEEHSEYTEYNSFYSDVLQVILPAQNTLKGGETLDVLAPSLPSKENPEKQKHRWEGDKHDRIQQPETTEPSSNAIDSAPIDPRIMRNFAPDDSFSYTSYEKVIEPQPVDAAPMAVRRRNSDTSEASMDIKLVQKAHADDSSTEESASDRNHNDSSQFWASDLERILEDSVSTMEKGNEQVPVTLKEYDLPPVAARRQETMETLPDFSET